jgi:hypothetical protein
MQRSQRTATYAVVRDASAHDGFQFGRVIGTALISLLTALIGTGVVSMVTLYARVSTIPDSVAHTQTQLDKQVEGASPTVPYSRHPVPMSNARVSSRKAAPQICSVFGLAGAWPIKCLERRQTRARFVQSFFHREGVL